MKRALAGAVTVIALGLAAAGCSSSSTPSTSTAAKSTTTAPSSTAPTNGSPAGGSSATEVGQAFIQAIESGSATSFCSTYIQTGEQASCQSSFSELTGSSVKIKNLALGKVVVEDSRALINFTASICSGTTCQTISNPNSAMAHGESFAKAYAQAANPNSTGSETMLSGAAAEHNGRWYATGF